MKLINWHNFFLWTLGLFVLALCVLFYGLFISPNNGWWCILLIFPVDGTINWVAPKIWFDHDFKILMPALINCALYGALLSVVGTHRKTARICLLGIHVFAASYFLLKSTGVTYTTEYPGSKEAIEELQKFK